MYAASVILDAGPITDQAFLLRLAGDGRVVQIDAACDQYINAPEFSASTTTWLSAVDCRDAAAVNTGWQLAVATRATFQADFRLVGADGDSRWFRVCCRYLSNVGEKLPGWSGVYLDIDDLKQEQVLQHKSDRRLRREIEAQNALLRSVGIGLVGNVIAPQVEAETAHARLRLLTPREKEVLGRLVAGDTSKEIARIVSGSPRTVDIHRGRILDKLSARNVAEAVRIASSVKWPLALKDN